MTTSITAYKQEEYLAVRVRIDPPASPPLNPIHLAILLDVSDSMKGERLDAVKRTLRAARTLFQPTDMITLVAFGIDARTVLANHLMSVAGMEEFYKQVEALSTNGCTNLSAGIMRLMETYSSATPFTAILLLTDGMINQGITTTSGLLSMMGQGLAELPAFALGYGADHNRTLLRALATRSYGSYTYVDSDEVLPIAMGDMLAGLRHVVLPKTQICIGPVSEGMGDLLAERDYWCVLKGVEGPPVQLFSGGDFITEATSLSPNTVEITEQIFRHRASQLLARAADIFENSVIGSGFVSIRAPVQTSERETIIAELKALYEEMTPLSERPLIIYIRSQINGILSTVTVNTSLEPCMRTRSANTTLESCGLARLANTTSLLTTQRGVGVGIGRGHGFTFSSPRQQNASEECHTSYCGDPV